MTGRGFILGIVLSSLAVTSAFAQAVRPGPPGVRVDEHYDRYARLGGSVFMGMHVSSGLRKADPDRVIVEIPAYAGYDSLCVQLASIDNAYGGTFRFPRPRTAGRYVFRLPTSKPQAFHDYALSQLAPLAYETNRCADADEQKLFMPVRWGEHDPHRQLRLLVLPPGRVRDVSVTVVRDDHSFSCNRITARAIAFTWSCELDLSAYHGETGLLVQFESWGQPLPPVRVRAWVPD